MIVARPPTDDRAWQVVTAYRDLEMIYVALAPANDSFANAAETSAVLITLAPSDARLDAETSVHHIRDDVIAGDRTEITRRISDGELTFHFLYTIERPLAAEEEREWIARLEAAGETPESFEELEQARHDAQRRAIEAVEQSGAPAELRAARIKLISANEQQAEWLQAAYELGTMTTHLPELLRAEDVDAGNVRALMTEGIRTLRRAAFKAQLQPDARFLQLYERLVTAYLFDCTDARPSSLRRAEAGWQFLIDRALVTQTLTDRLLTLKACTLISRSVYDGEDLLDRAMALLFPVMRGDMQDSITGFHTVMGMGAVWYRAAQTLGPSFHAEALACFDFAETYATAGSAAIFTDEEDQKEHVERAGKLLIEAQMAQQSVQWHFHGGSLVGSGPPIAVEHVGTLLFLRPLFSSRRFPLINRFEPSPHLLPYDAEPPQLSLEAALHRTLYRHFNTIRLGGPQDFLGMTRVGTLSSRGRTGREWAQEEWRTQFEILFSTARIVLLLLWDSDGVMWETEAVLARTPENCVLLMLPADVAPDAGAAWERARVRLPAVSPYRPEGGFLLFGRDGSLVRTLDFSAIWTDALWRELAAHSER